MSKSSKNIVKIDNQDYNLMSILPLILIATIVPLIVRLKVVDLPGIRGGFRFGHDMNLDFFAYYKMVWLLVFTGLGMVMFLMQYYNKNKIHIKKTNIYIPMGIYGALIILSTIFSTYKDVALIGFMDRYENMFVLLAYMVCMFLAINLINDEKQVKCLLLFLGVSSLIISILGIFQFANLDPFATELGKILIVPAKIGAKIESMNFSFTGQKTIYSTLFNPNYVGVYTNILFPLSTTVLLLSKKRLHKLFYGVVSILSFITLLGSGSRTGFIGIGLYVILLIIMFRSLIIKRWKSALFMVVIIGLVLYGANYYTEGFLKARTLAIKDSVLTVSENNLKDIILVDDKAQIIFEDYEMNIILNNGNFDFYDASGNEIETIRESNSIKFNIEPYNNNVFERYIYEDNVLLKSIILTDMGWLDFNLIINDDDEFKFLSSKGEMVDLEHAPKWGFEGRDNLASGRGYIWSRSIPLLKRTMVLGFGPDTYALFFPQEDYIGRLLHASPINILVDKPHNMYLQTGINTGVISLIAILSIFFIYLKSSFQVYIKRKTYDNFIEIAGVSIFFAVCSYLMVGVLNDSVVSIAPVFWILLGTGMSINMKLRDQLE